MHTIRYGEGWIVALVAHIGPRVLDQRHVEISSIQGETLGREDKAGRLILACQFKAGAIDGQQLSAFDQAQESAKKSAQKQTYIRSFGLPPHTRLVIAPADGFCDWINAILRTTR